MKFSDEVWKEIPGTDGKYLVSSCARVKSLKGLLCPFVNNGYYKVNIKINKIWKTVYLHRLVAEAFIPNLENKPQINHINGNKLDNRIKNLEWCTEQQNTLHAYRILNHGPCKLTWQQVEQIRFYNKKGVPTKEICKMFCVSRSCVDNICKHRRRKCLI